MSTVESWVLWPHVGAGVIALLAGLGALVSAKGGRRHRRAGRVFVGTMGIVVTTSLLLVVLRPTPFRVFLGLVAVFSGYLAFSGYRVLSRTRPAGGAAVDWVGAAGVVIACLGLGGWGIVRLASGESFGVVLVAFGGIGLTFGVADVRAFRGSARPSGRFVPHLQRMVGAFIATVSAVSAVTLTGALGFVAWLWPTVALVPLIVYWSRTYDTAGPPTG